jgi:hypothetical protein
MTASDRRPGGNGTATPPPLPPLRPVPLVDGEPPCPGIYQQPESYDLSGFVPDPKLAREIRRHLVLNFTPKFKAQRPSSILFLLSPTGHGKTTTPRASRAGIGLLILPGADLGGSEPANEGAPVKTLNAALAWLEWNRSVNGIYTALMLDDIEASILPQRPDATGTNNTEQLRGKLQALADRVDAPCQVWTGNSSRHFHPALLRPGRCNLFRFTPDPDTKAAIIQDMFQPTDHWQRRQLAKIAHRYRHRPIAWWADLRLTQRNAALDALIDDVGLDFAALEAAPEPVEALDIDALTAAAAQADLDQGADFSH